MDTRYEAYSFADPLFYDSPVRWGAHEEFAALGEPLPDGWVQHDRGTWVGVQPRGLRLPEQGWKIHVSACLDNAEEVLATVRAYCLGDRLPFKFLRGLPLVQLQNAKYAARGSSGKFCTLYPVDDAQLERCLSVLGAELAGQPGPYILSDLRWGAGPLHLRYGAFVERWRRSETGEAELAFADPDGNLIPDVRAAVFELPDWAPVPDFLRPTLDERRTARSGQLPYQVERALHFSNAGGIYLAKDAANDRQVVLKEARPHAGLDQRGTDSVARLRHEGEILQELAGVDAVPALIDRLTAWEHHFMVQEYVEGDTLNSWLVANYPLVHPDQDAEELARYTAEALALLDQVASGLAEIHARGVVFGDLHPRNLIRRPDGRVVFIDFELSSMAAQFVRPALGAAGFADPGRSGTELDEYALAAIKLWMFLPMQQLLALDPDKVGELIDAAAELFPLPAEFVDSIRRQLERPTPSTRPGPRSGAAPRTRISPAERAELTSLLTAPEPDWPALRDSLTAGILAAATPERTDRLFPGDVAQFGVDALGLAYGAAGVLYALHVTGHEVDEEHVRWLLHAERRRDPRPGLYTGTHGVAYTLDLLGHPAPALDLLTRLLELPLEEQGLDLAGGLPGTVLTLLHFAGRTGDAELLDQALAAAQLLGERQDKRDPAPGDPVGLLRGAAGQALAFLRLYEHTGQEWLLERTELSLGRDLERCVTTPDGSLQVHDGTRVLPYLESGSTGIGSVLHDYLAHRPDSPFAPSLPAIRLAAEPEFVVLPNLFNGRAGLIDHLCRLRRGPDGDRITALIDRHRRLLAWHMVPYEGHLAFPGEQLLRLSTDLATGSAGVLLALGTALADTPGLPLTAPPGAPDLPDPLAATGSRHPTDPRRPPGAPSTRTEGERSWRSSSCRAWSFRRTRTTTTPAP
ncbi:class III lanthionine synthetase LanKC [Kitasatospora mediocidica]|uniref:class III lanthionine synthetase LanKC n=1 Tax=Kitasatospora mediocidica TaxID=58352 RepID=UPI0007C71C60